MGLLGSLAGAGAGGGGINVGSAIAYLELNTSAFQAGIQTAVGQLNGMTSSFSTAMTNVGSTLTNIGSSLTHNLTQPIVGGFKTAVTNTMNLEEKLSKVEAVSGATADEMIQLKKAAQEMALGTKFTTSEVADAMVYMGMAGWDAQQILGGLSGVINLAAASGENLGTVSDIVTDDLTAFGMSADEAGHFADVLAIASAKSNTNVGIMGESFKYAAPLAGTLGYSIEDVGLAIGLMANNSIKGSMAGTALRGALTRMINPTKDAIGVMVDLGLATEETQQVWNHEKISQKEYQVEQATLDLEKAQVKYNTAVQKYGSESAQAQTALINVEKAQNKVAEAERKYQVELMGTIETTGINNELLFDSAGNAKDFKEVLGTLRTAFSKLTPEEQASAAATLFGQRAMSGMLAIINSSDEDFNKLAGHLNESKDAAEDMANTMMDNLAGSILKLKSAMEVLSQTIGDRLAPHIRKLADWLTKVATKFSEMSDTQADFIIKVGLVVAAIGPLLLILGSVFKTIGQVASIFEIFTGHLTKFGSSAKTAASSFGTLAGEALKLVALAAVILSVAKAMQMLVDAAIKLYSAGTGAIITFAGMTTGALIMVGAIAGIASACTAGAAGLLSLGATVLMVSAGIALVTAAVALLVEAFTHLMQAMLPLADKMPIFAEYGMQAAAGMAAFGAAAALAAPAIVAVDVALAALDITAGIAVPIINGLAAAMAALNTTLLALNVSIKSFGEIFSQTITTIADAVAYAVRLIIQLITEMVDTIIALFKKLKYELIGDPIVYDIIDGVIDGFLRMVQKVIEFISDLVSKIVQFFVDILNKTRSFISDVISAISDFINNVISKVVEFFSNIINKAIEFFTNVWNKVKEFFTNLINTIVEKVKEIIDKVREFFSNLIDLIIEKVQEILGKIKEFFSNMISAISEFISNAWEKIKSFVSDVINAIVDFINDMLNKIKDFFVQLKNTVSEKLQEVHAFIKEKLNAIVDFVKELIPRMLQAGKDLITALWDGIKEVFGNLWSWVQEHFGKIIDFVQSAAEKIRSIGSGIKEAVGGLIDGSHATGLSYVPFNGYVAQLHEGERVLTKQQNREYTQGRSGNGGDTYNIYSYEKLDEYGIRKELMKMKRQLDL